ncbi:MAG TPA: hypothetical protein VJT32_02105 [bacterium]|nr:hypothetical protein [bacterium]
MPAVLIAICSNPDCTRHAAAPRASDLPLQCPSCGAAMLAQCWKCERLLTDPFTSYCIDCGVPLKRILPLATRPEPLLAICANPECSGAVQTSRTVTFPSRCPKCHSPLVSHCWKCGARIIALEQHYCQGCGVPLKRLRATSKT